MKVLRALSDMFLVRTCQTYPDLYWGYPEVQHAKNCTCYDEGTKREPR